MTTDKICPMTDAAEQHGTLRVDVCPECGRPEKGYRRIVDKGDAWFCPDKWHDQPAPPPAAQVSATPQLRNTLVRLGNKNGPLVTPKEYILRSIRHSGDGCWLWAKSKQNRGYGVLQVCGKHVQAHRFSFEVYKGPIPDGMFVLHTCDVRLCVRPDHLYLGKDADNLRDQYERKRRPAKLSEEQKQQLIYLRSKGVSQNEAASIIGISRQSISYWENSLHDKAKIEELEQQLKSAEARAAELQQRFDAAMVEKNLQINELQAKLDAETARANELARVLKDRDEADETRRLNRIASGEQDACTIAHNAAIDAVIAHPHLYLCEHQISNLRALKVPQ